MRAASKADTEFVVTRIIQDIESKNPKKKAHNCELTREYFGPLLQELFKIHDYELHKTGDLVKNAEDAKNAYIKSTNDLKEQYRAQKWTKLSGQVVTVAGGALALAGGPIGWGILAAGTVATVTTDIVQLVDTRYEKTWIKSRDKLKYCMLHPFEGTVFAKIHDAMSTAYGHVKDVVSAKHFATAVQCFGIQYFILREGRDCDKRLPHEEAMEAMVETLNFFAQTDIRMTDDSMIVDKDGVPVDLQELADSADKMEVSSLADARSLKQNVAKFATMGILAGVALTGLYGGIKIAEILPRLSKALYSLGEYSASAFQKLVEAGPYLAIIGGIIGVVIEAMALVNIDSTFQPYYDYSNKCEDLLDKRKDEGAKMDKNFQMLFKAMNKPRKVPARKSKELVAVENQIHELKKKQRQAIVAKDFAKAGELQTQIDPLEERKKELTKA